MNAFVAAFAVSALLVPAFAQQPAYLADPKYQKQVAAAKDPHELLDNRIGHWKKALKTSGGICLRCLDEIAILQIRSGDLKAAINSAAALEQLATRGSDKADAEILHATALLHMKSGKPNPQQLAEADTALKAAMANDPSLIFSAYLDGMALAQLNRDDDARLLFASYAKSTPATDRFHARAAHFAANPAIARAKMAPPFTVTTADGKQFTLDDMGGRVVLVDFWATWCGPCNAELPHVKKIAREFAGQPFVLISVSWDSDPAKWQAFIDKNGMSWSQYRDADHQLSTAYGVNAIPHYFTIDSDGVVQAEEIGGGGDIEGKIRKLIARAPAGGTATATLTAASN